MDSKTCNICLKISKIVLSLHDLDQNKIQWLTKLQFLIPELEWLDEYTICKNCCKRLQSAWKFKKIVLDIEKGRRKEIANVCSDIENDNIDNIWDVGNKYDEKDNPNDNQEGELFACYNCCKSFSSKEILKYHTDVEHKEDKALFNQSLGNQLAEENLTETIVSRHFLSEDALNFNDRQTTKYEIYSEQNNTNIKEESDIHFCAKCNIDFSSVQEYESHNFSEHLSNKPKEVAPLLKKRRGRKPLRKFHCEICNEEFDRVKFITEHCVSVHGMIAKNVKPYSCEKCEMHFATSANLEQHRNYHDKNRKHICSSCGKTFITKSDLTVHEYTHYNRRNYRCTICDKAFNTNKNLRTHHLVVHTDRNMWKYACSVCEKRFPLKTNYDQHFRRHTGEKEHVCLICEKSFISKSELQRHMHVHSNIKAFKCSDCDKEYKERRTYQLHLAKKHGIGNAKVIVREKKFVCHICPSQFYDKQKLTRHIFSHSGLKPFSCYVCDKKFTAKSYLKIHLRTVHKIEQLNNI